MMDNRNDHEAEHVPEEPNHQPQLQPAAQQQPQQLHQHGEAYGLHREEMHAMKEELAREKREIKDDFARKERELKGELADRVKEMKAEMANNKKEMKEEMEKKENAMAQREKELKDEMAEKEKHMKDELNKKDTEFIQLREQVAASGTYWTVSLILFVILIASLAVIANRHWELNSAVERNSELTSTVQTLREHKGACGTEQLDELKECRIKLQELIEIKGKCLVFEENLRGNSSLALVKQTDFLMKEMEEFKDRSAKDAERKDKCDQHLQHVQNQLSMIMSNATALILEKEEWKNKYKKCQDLSTNQENS